MTWCVRKQRSFKHQSDFQVFCEQSLRFLFVFQEQLMSEQKAVWGSWAGTQFPYCLLLPAVRAVRSEYHIGHKNPATESQTCPGCYIRHSFSFRCPGLNLYWTKVILHRVDSYIQNGDRWWESRKYLVLIERTDLMNIWHWKVLVSYLASPGVLILTGMNSW